MAPSLFGDRPMAPYSSPLDAGMAEGRYPAVPGRYDARPAGPLGRAMVYGAVHLGAAGDAWAHPTVSWDPVRRPAKGGDDEDPPLPRLYAILGLRPDATEEEIRRTYRRLALEWHPTSDRETPRAAERFKEISEAYAVSKDGKVVKFYQTA